MPSRACRRFQPYGHESRSATHWRAARQDADYGAPKDAAWQSDARQRGRMISPTRLPPSGQGRLSAGCAGSPARPNDARPAGRASLPGRHDLKNWGRAVGWGCWGRFRVESVRARRRKEQHSPNMGHGACARWPIMGFAEPLLGALWPELKTTRNACAPAAPTRNRTAPTARASRRPASPRARRAPRRYYWPRSTPPDDTRRAVHAPSEPSTNCPSRRRPGRDALAEAPPNWPATAATNWTAHPSMTSRRLPAISGRRTTLRNRTRNAYSCVRRRRCACAPWRLAGRTVAPNRRLGRFGVRRRRNDRPARVPVLWARLHRRMHLPCVPREGGVLMQRIRAGNVAAHPRRQLILDTLSAQPGLGFRRLAAATNLPAGCLAHHVRLLARFGLVWLVRQDVRLLHFAGSRPPPEIASRLAALASLTPKQYGVLRVVERLAPVFQRDVLDALAMPRSTSQHALGRLAAVGLVTRRTFGPRVVYHVMPRPAWPTREVAPTMAAVLAAEVSA